MKKTMSCAIAIILAQQTEHARLRQTLYITDFASINFQPTTIKYMDNVQNGRPQNVYLKSVWLK